MGHLLISPVSRAEKLFKCIDIVKLLVDGNQLLQQTVDSFIAENLVESVCSSNGWDVFCVKQKRKCCWLLDGNFGIYGVLSVLGFHGNLNQYFFQTLLPSNWQKQLYCFYFYEGKVSAILLFQARDNEIYEPLICLYSVNNT